MALNETFEIDWKHGEGYYYVKYEESGAAEGTITRRTQASSDFTMQALDLEGNNYKSVAGFNQTYRMKLANGTYYIGFRFSSDGKYAITIS